MAHSPREFDNDCSWVKIAPCGCIAIDRSRMLEQYNPSQQASASWGPHVNPAQQVPRSRSTRSTDSDLTARGMARGEARAQRAVSAVDISFSGTRAQSTPGGPCQNLTAANVAELDKGNNSRYAFRIQATTGENILIPMCVNASQAPSTHITKSSLASYVWVPEGEDAMEYQCLGKWIVCQPGEHYPESLDLD